MRSYDVAVIGAGPAGSTLAALAARAGRSVLLLEREAAVRSMLQTIAPGSLSVLHAIGAADRFGDLGLRRVEARRSRWGSESAAAVTWRDRPHGLGFIVDRGRFDGTLRDHAVASGADLRTGEHCRSVHRADDGWIVGCGAREVYARFIVDASGRASWLSRRLVGEPVVYDRLVGVIDRSAIVARDASAEVAVLSAAAGWSVSIEGGATRETTRFTDADLLERGSTRGSIVSARSQRARSCGGDRWIAVGDAAAAYDPLSSRGLDSALRTALLAAPVLLATGAEECARRSDAYMRALQESYVAYLAVRRLYYAMETERRSTFWTRRAVATVPEGFNAASA